MRLWSFISSFEWDQFWWNCFKTEGLDSFLYSFFLKWEKWFTSFENALLCIASSAEKPLENRQGMMFFIKPIHILKEHFSGYNTMFKTRNRVLVKKSIFWVGGGPLTKSSSIWSRAYIQDMVKFNLSKPPLLTQ